MQIKNVVFCYAEHLDGRRILKSETEFTEEPSYKQIEELLSEVKLSDHVDYEIDYSTGVRLPEWKMPRKTKVKSIYAVVEKRFYREVEVDG